MITNDKKNQKKIGEASEERENVKGEREKGTTYARRKIRTTVLFGSFLSRRNGEF